MNFVRTLTGCLILVGSLASGVVHAELEDVLKRPSLPTQLATKRPLNAVVATASRLIAVGARGHIVYSDNNGASWTQAAVPVSSDLTAVYFSSDASGWAVGHDGVVLHTQDAGQTWALQFDGNQAAELIRTYYAKKAEEGDEQARSLLPEIERDFAGGADKPFLDVWFANDSDGFIVGAFNMIFRTRDGGKSWTPWYERIDNPRRLHIYAIRGRGGRVYAVGELGLFTRLDADAQRFVAEPSPYAGSFFGVLPVSDGALVFGMRGNAYHVDDGAGQWHKLDIGVVGGLTGAAALADGRVAMVSTAGDVVLGHPANGGFEKLQSIRPMAFAGVAFVGPTNALAFVGNNGTSVAALPRK